MFKRLFCDHYFDRYHTSTESLLFSPHLYFKFHFVCKKCGKTTTITEDEVRLKASKIENRVAKEVVLGDIEYNAYSKCKFEIDGYNYGTIYGGKVAYYLSNEYRKYSDFKKKN